MKRHAQGWLDVFSKDLDEVVALIRKHKSEKTVFTKNTYRLGIFIGNHFSAVKIGKGINVKAISIGYLGNVVDLWYTIYITLPTWINEKSRNIKSINQISIKDY